MLRSLSAFGYQTGIGESATGGKPLKLSFFYIFWITLKIKLLASDMARETTPLDLVIVHSVTKTAAT